MRTIVLLIALLGALSCSGCLFTHITTPFDTDLDETVLGPDIKTGEASTTSLLWLVAWGDAGTRAAAENGNITTVNHMDMRFFNVLWGLYTKHTTIVYGK